MRDAATGTVRSGELLRWLEDTQDSNERARRSHAKRRSVLRASPHIPPGTVVVILVARRPEDMRLEPDPVLEREDSANQDSEAAKGSGNLGGFAEINSTVGQAQGS